MQFVCLVAAIFIIARVYSDSVTAALDLKDCDCRDWYGRCKNKGDMWIDDDIWSYKCESNLREDGSLVGCLVPQGSTVSVNSNNTIDGFWFSCQMNDQRILYEEESRCLVNGTNYHVGETFRDGFFSWICLTSGRWVTGCYYQNETENWINLKIGEIAYNGLVKHGCDRYDDYPGRVQYFAEVRTDIAHKHPSNKGINRNLPELIDNRLKVKPIRWLHGNAANFIPNQDAFRSRIRYLPASRQILSAPPSHHSHSSLQLS